MNRVATIFDRRHKTSHQVVATLLAAVPVEELQPVAEHQFQLATPLPVVNRY